MTSLKFGTDGIRGLVNPTQVSPAFAFELGVAACAICPPQAEVLIGTDTRESASSLQKHFAEGLMAGGATPNLMGVIPTPALAYEVFAGEADLGVVITASHNPHKYNGFKFFDSKGLKLDRVREQAVEDALDDKIITKSSAKSSSPIRSRELLAYRDRIDSLVEGLGKTPWTGVVDCAHGATVATAPSVLNKVFSQLHMIGSTPNGRNINQDCGSTAMELLRTKVVETEADIGIAFDGDGDRVLFIDSSGNTVTGDHVLYVLGMMWHQVSRLRGGVVGTVMSNLALERKLETSGIPFVRVGVGDKYVLEALHDRGWKLGGEASGHVISLEHSPTGDGLIVALLVLEVMHRMDSSLQEMTQELNLLPQVLVNVPHLGERSYDDEIQVVVQDFERRLGKDGRVLVRGSGTEPVVRVMVESVPSIDTAALANSIATEVGRILNA